MQFCWVSSNTHWPVWISTYWKIKKSCVMLVPFCFNPGPLNDAEILSAVCPLIYLFIITIFFFWGNGDPMSKYTRLSEMLLKHVQVIFSSVVIKWWLHRWLDNLNLHFEGNEHPIFHSSSLSLVTLHMSCMKECLCMYILCELTKKMHLCICW